MFKYNFDGIDLNSTISPEIKGIQLLFEDYSIENEQLIPSFFLKDLDKCFTYAELFLDFIKIQTVESVIIFVSKYGLLGKCFLQDKTKDAFLSGVSEPIDWILTHVSSVRMCLRLSELIENMDVIKIKNYLHNYLFKENDSYIIKVANKENINILNLAYFAKLKEAYTAESDFSDEYIINLAKRIRRHIININLTGIHVTFDSVPDISKIDMEQKYLVFHSLIELIYWILSDIIFNKKIKTCKYCGDFFIQSHGRQSYCPSPSGASSCANKKRYGDFVNKNRRK